MRTGAMRRGHWPAIAAAVVAAAGVSAGCGGGSALSLDPVAAAATKTQHAGAARIRFAIAFRGPQLPGGKTIRLRGAGAIDGTSGELTLTAGSLLAQYGAPAGSDATVKEIFLEQNGDHVLYLRSGLFASHLPGGRHWLELDLSKFGQAAGLDLGNLMSGSQVSPGDVLSLLKAEGSKVRKLGAATVGGIATTHYRITIDTAKALEAKGLTSSPLLVGIAAKLPTVPVDIWIGKDGLLRRIAASFGSSGMRVRVGLKMDIYDYGAHVAIAAPPSSDVFDVTKLAEQRFGTTSNS